MHLPKSNKIKFVFLWAIVNIFTTVNLLGQFSKDSVSLMIGDRIVDSVVMEMGRSQLVNKNKFSTSKRGVTVMEFTYSMFALGSSVKETVRDSMFPSKMKDAILDRKINYRHINIESVKLVDKNKNILLPKIDTLKIKFLYP